MIEEEKKVEEDRKFANEIMSQDAEDKASEKANELTTTLLINAVMEALYDPKLDDIYGKARIKRFRDQLIPND